MCNKCETQTQTTPFLAMVAGRAFLKSGSPARWAYAIQEQIKNNTRDNKDKHNRLAEYDKPCLRDIMQNLKVSGNRMATLRAIALKPTNISRVPTTLMEAEATVNYLCSLDNTNKSIRYAIEPKYAEARSIIDAGEWEPIALHILVCKEELAKARDVYETQNVIDILHRLHVSTANPKMVAYYPSLRHAREGREVRTKLGKYLTNFMGMYQLTHSDIKDMTEKHMANMASHNSWTVEFIAHNDKDGWRRVYDTRGVDSCMAGIDAVHVYANELSELRLAYIRDDDGEILSRCIVRDDPDGDKTGWLRVYPDPNGCAEGRFMLDWLEDNGYPKCTDLDGCLLTAEEGVDNSYVCPYIDRGAYGDQTVGTTYKNGVTYLLVGNGEYNANNTNGYATLVSSCDECGGLCNDEDLMVIEDEYSVCTVCSHCFNDLGVYAYGDRGQSWCRVDTCTQVGDNWYKNEYLSSHDIYYCEYSDEYMHINDMESTVKGLINSKYAEFLYHKHEGYEFAYEHDVVELSDGTTCHKYDEEALQATIDFATQAVA